MQNKDIGNQGFYFAWQLLVNSCSKISCQVSVHPLLQQGKKPPEMSLVVFVNIETSGSPAVRATNVSGKRLIWNWYKEPLVPPVHQSMSTMSTARCIGPPPYNWAVKVAIWKDSGDPTVTCSSPKWPFKKLKKKPDQQETVFFI